MGLLFGPAGVPNSSPKPDSVSGIRRVKELGLELNELSFTHGVRMKEEAAAAVKEAAAGCGVRLSVHAPYYINLNSPEKEKVEASKQRLWAALKVGDACGAEYACFHPAYLQGVPAKKVGENVAAAVGELLDKAKGEGLTIKPGPEVTGRVSQWGSLEEILELYLNLGKRVVPVVDFSHVHARGNGGLKTGKDFENVFDVIASFDKALLGSLRMHVQGIAYSEKGEKRHLDLAESDFDYKAFFRVARGMGVSGTVICESPCREVDALKMKAFYASLG